MNEDQGHTSWYSAVNCSLVESIKYHHTNVKRNWFVNVRRQDIIGFFFTCVLQQNHQSKVFYLENELNDKVRFIVRPTPHHRVQNSIEIIIIKMISRAPFPVFRIMLNFAKQVQTPKYKTHVYKRPKTTRVQATPNEAVKRDKKY